MECFQCNESVKTNKRKKSEGNSELQDTYGRKSNTTGMVIFVNRDMLVCPEKLNNLLVIDV